eukprot:Lankesteria_metandrocarpae@DN4721_c0_g1_i2.p1
MRNDRPGNTPAKPRARVAALLGSYYTPDSTVTTPRQASRNPNHNQDGDSSAATDSSVPQVHPPAAQAGDSRTGVVRTKKQSQVDSARRRSTVESSDSRGAATGAGAKERTIDGGVQRKQQYNHSPGTGENCGTTPDGAAISVSERGVGRSGAQRKVNSIRSAPQQAIDLDSPQFDAPTYFQYVIDNMSLKQVLSEGNRLKRDISTYGGEIQSVVYENYGRFLSTTEMVVNMSNNVATLESSVAQLQTRIDCIQSTSERVDSIVAKRATKIEELMSIRKLLNQLKDVLALPRGMLEKMASNDFVAALQLFNDCAALLKGHCDIECMKLLAVKALNLASKCEVRLCAQLAPPSASGANQGATAIDGSATPADTIVESNIVYSHDQPSAAVAVLIAKTIMEYWRCSYGFFETDEGLMKPHSTSTIQLLTTLLTGQRIRIYQRLVQILHSDQIFESVAPLHIRTFFQKTSEFIASDIVTLVENLVQLFSDSVSPRTTQQEHVTSNTSSAHDTLQYLEKWTITMLNEFWLRLSLIACMLMARSISKKLVPDNIAVKVKDIKRTDVLSNEARDPPAKTTVETREPISVPIEDKATTSNNTSTLTGTISQLVLPETSTPSVVSKLYAEGLNTLRVTLKPLYRVFPSAVGANFSSFLLTAGCIITSYRFVGAIDVVVQEMANLKRKVHANLFSVADDNSSTAATRGSATDDIAAYEHFVLLELVSCCTEVSSLVTALVGTDDSSMRRALLNTVSSMVDTFFRSIITAVCLEVCGQEYLAAPILRSLVGASQRPSTQHSMSNRSVTEYSAQINSLAVSAWHRGGFALGLDISTAPWNVVESAVKSQDINFETVTNRTHQWKGTLTNYEAKVTTGASKLPPTDPIPKTSCVTGDPRKLSRTPLDAPKLLDLLVCSDAGIRSLVLTCLLERLQCTTVSSAEETTGNADSSDGDAIPGVHSDGVHRPTDSVVFLTLCKVCLAFSGKSISKLSGKINDIFNCGPDLDASRDSDTALPARNPSVGPPQVVSVIGVERLQTIAMHGARVSLRGFIIEQGAILSAKFCALVDFATTLNDDVALQNSGNQPERSVTSASPAAVAVVSALRDLLLTLSTAASTVCWRC